MMAEFPTNPQRLTPYPNFRFKLRYKGAYVAGISKVGGLTSETTIVKHRSGGDPSAVHLAPGQTEYSPITLERGVSYDVAFDQWANKVFDLRNSTQSTSETSALADYRRDLTLEMHNEAGQIIISYTIYSVWVSSYSAMSELDANGNAFIIQSMTLENEGWERDTSVKPLAEPTFTDPAS